MFVVLQLHSQEIPVEAEQVLQMIDELNKPGHDMPFSQFRHPFEQFGK